MKVQEQKPKAPSNNTEVTSIDVKDFKNLLTERETERQHLKNKVKELEDALTIENSATKPKN